MGRTVWAVLCLDSQALDDPDVMAQVGDLYSGLPCEGYVLWLTAFDEQRVSRGQIASLVNLLQSLRSSNTNAPVLQFYGGFFSALLRPFGIQAVSHGVAYGEQRDVTPVVGGGLPPAKYYLPYIHDEILVIDLVRIAQGMTVAEFTARICHCIICQGLLRNGVDALLDAYSSTERRPYRGGFRDFPTPDVYRMTRFHFMQNRQIEMQRLTGLADHQFAQEVQALSDAYSQYADRLYPAPTFLRTWNAALTSLF